MNVQEMLEGVGFDDIWVYVMAEYCRERTPDESGRAYVSLKRMYSDLLSRNPDKNKDDMLLTVKRLSSGGEALWDIASFCGKDGLTYSISFVDWDTVLGYEMLSLSLEEYGAARTAAHILWELSVNGFSEDEMKKRREELKTDISSRLSDVSDITEELSFDELCGELGMSLFPGDDMFKNEEDKENQKVIRRFDAAAAEQIKCHS